MAEGINQRPLIVRRKKRVAGDGHHGGAWKVAYADFVTAMMAFFMLMWLLNATTEQQRKGIADYFSPNIPITRISGGGDGSFGGDDVFSEATAAQNGTGATSLRPTEGRQALGLSGSDHRAEREESRLEALAEAIAQGAGDDTLAEIARQQVQTRLSDEGLVIEIFSRPEAPLFVSGSLAPSGWLEALAATMANLFATVENPVAIAGHVPAEPIVVATGSRWSRSLGEAEAMRQTLTQAGLAASRVSRVTGHADRSAAVPDDRMSLRNHRIEVILLREFH